MSDEQKAAQRQPSAQQQPAAAAQQSAEAAGQQETAEQRAEEQLDAQAASTPGQAAAAQTDAGPDTAQGVLSQPSQTAQEHAADPQEPQLMPTTLTTAADEQILPHAESQLTDLPASERLQILLEAIKKRTWEPNEEEKASTAKLQDDSMRLPASGYSEIGAISQGKFQGQMLNPDRTFYPGQSYNPEVSYALTHKQMQKVLCSGQYYNTT